MALPPPPSKVKLDELFFFWISLPETQSLVRSLLTELKNGRTLLSPEKGSGSHGAGHARSPGGGHAIHSPTRSPLSPHSPFISGSSALTPLSPTAQSIGLPRSPTARSPSARSPPRVSLNFHDFGAIDKIQTGSAFAKDVAENDDEKAGHDSRQVLVKRKREVIPRFYFPRASTAAPDSPEVLVKARTIFAPHAEGISSPEDFLAVTKTFCELPSFLNGILFSRIDQKNQGVVTLNMFLDYWKRELGPYDRPTRFFRVLKQPQNPHLHPDDFRPMMNDILATHPGLEFLEQTPEFQERYADTVIARIFYTVNRSSSGRISLEEFLNSKLFQASCIVDEEEDINCVTDFFSYEHFYVIYCKFWELDTDHNFLIDRKDVSRYANHALTWNIVERVFQQAGHKFVAGTPPGMMRYQDFIWFLLSEEDKTTETSIEYWFRCVDLDGRGYITAAEMKFFYAEQMHRMECLAQEVVPFEDILCQMFDMLHPKHPDRITLADLKRCKTSGILFNVLFNLNKFLAWEQRDPFLARQEQLGPDQSEWDRFARFEYARLCMDEETPIEQTPNEVLNPWQTSHESPF